MHRVEAILIDMQAAQAKLDRRHQGFVIPAELTEIVGQRKFLVNEIGLLRQLYNQKSEEIGRARRDSTHTIAELEEAKSAQRELREIIQQKEQTHRELYYLETQILLTIPNFPADHTPDGASDKDNLVLRTWGRKPEFDFTPKDHVDIAQQLDILDLERAGKISGSRFSVLRGAGSRLQRALVSFMLELHRKNGFEEVTVPYLVNRKTMTGTGQLPKFEFDLFKTTIGGNELFLIPTAEVPVTNLHADELLEESGLPKKYAAYSENFRAEAGSTGKDTRGILRQHQFPKVELVELAHPNNSWDELERLTINAEHVLQQMGLHYRLVALCAGDLGFASKFTYDLEVWLPGQDNYREISSCSNYEDFQARRANIRYRKADTKKTDFVHTLNGSGLAVGRSIVAILEQGQQVDGSVTIPEPLIPYTGFSRILPGGRTQ